MQHWIEKFRLAFRGLFLGSRGESSFLVHGLASLIVCLTAWMLECSLVEWCILLLCIGLVISLELMNSALEHLARGLCQEKNAEVGHALDIASGAVLAASLIAILIGLLVLGTRMVTWWTNAA